VACFHEGPLAGLGLSRPGVQEPRGRSCLMVQLRDRMQEEMLLRGFEFQTRKAYMTAMRGFMAFVERRRVGWDVQNCAHICFI